MRSFDEWADNLAEHISAKTNNTNKNTSEPQTDVVLAFMEHLKSVENKSEFLRDIIWSGFLWSETKEGVSYWQSVVNVLSGKK